MDWVKLNAEETRVLVHKGTERPFTGEYDAHWEKGHYLCKRCGTPLYQSGDKFDSRCGWPSFDLEIPGAVSRHPDPDGERTEITCAHCGAHLGHVFIGEGFTPRNTRHCVNSVSLDFVPVLDTAYFAGGCFWGTQYYLQQVPGVLSTQVGYMGGRIPNPTYEMVSQGNTGHLEANQVIYDPLKVSYADLVQLFYEIHDYTQTNGQGPDIGPQYLSAIFMRTAHQQRHAERITEILRQKGHAVATQLLPSAPFYPAESYHQDYYLKNGKKPYCHVRRKIFE